VNISSDQEVTWRAPQFNTVLRLKLISRQVLKKVKESGINTKLLDI